MKFESKLVDGIIIKRYKRFLADIELSCGKVITVYVPNTGSMKTCWEAGWQVLLSESGNTKRKYRYTLEMLHNGNTWIGINTSLTNKIAHEAIAAGTIKELKEYSIIKPEVKIGASRLDFQLTNQHNQTCYVEVKNVTLFQAPDIATFPDAITKRGQKHIQELINIQKDGDHATLLFIVQREDVNSFQPAKEIDLTYAELLKSALKQGVEVLVYQCSISPKEIKVRRKLPINI